MKAKKINVVINRINMNKYEIDGKVLDYFELINWFEDFVTG